MLSMAKLGNSISGVVEKPHNNLLYGAFCVANSMSSADSKWTFGALIQESVI